MTYLHMPPTPFTEQQFNKLPLHTPGNSTGLYIWFSQNPEIDYVEMHVRWITDDFESPTKFSGYFQGINIKFKSVSLVDFEQVDGDEFQLESEDYLTFDANVTVADFDP